MPQGDASSSSSWSNGCRYKGEHYLASSCLSGRVPWAPGKQRLQTMETKERDEEKGKRKMGEVDTQK